MMIRRRRGERGDVAMEYVLVMVCIIVPLVCGAKVIFNASGRSTASAAIGLEKEDDFGIVGNDLVKMFRRTFMGLALPVP